MRTIDLSASVIKPSNLAWWHRSWTGRFVLAALLMAAAAFTLIPDRASADHNDLHTRCTTAAGADNAGLIADCVALITAAESLEGTDDTNINWIGVAAEDALPSLASTDDWDGVTIASSRVTEVRLADTIGLSGTLADEWADLTELTALDLSGNGLTGSANRSVWTFFDSLTTLNLGGNPMLQPSPTLNLMAAVTKNSDVQVALSFDNIWYTTEVATHEYRYSADGGTSWGPNDADGSMGWMSMATGCDDGATPPVATLCDKLDSSTPQARVRNMITVTPEEDVDTYVFEVRSVKVDDGGTDTDTSDDTTTRSEESRIDVVGPQTLTAGSSYDLAVAVTYSDATSGDTDALGVEVAEDMIKFDPKEASDSVTVTLGAPAGATSGSSSFPVDILSADSAPSSSRIPNREIVNDGRATRIDLSRYFDNIEGLNFLTPTYSRAGIVTAEVIGTMLHITPQREGVTEVTVTAINEGRGTTSQTFRATVVSPNNPPQLVGNIPDLTLYLDDAGTRVDMSQYFRDLDYGVLRFIPQSADPMVVTASSVGNYVIFNVTGLGETRMTIIAQDQAGASAFGSFTVTVLDPNNAPEAVGSIAPQSIRLEAPVSIALGSYFTDPDGDPLTYTAESADDSIVTAEVEGDVVTLTAVVADGESSVTVTAMDDGGAGRSESGEGGDPKSATQEIIVVTLSANRPPEVVGEGIPDFEIQFYSEPLGVEVEQYFSDPEGDELSFVAVGSDDTLARVDYTELHEIPTVQVILLRRVDAGAQEVLEITATARDPQGASVSDTFNVTVQGNLPPEAVGRIDDQALLEGRDVLLEVEEYFTDPNANPDDPEAHLLTYMASSANASAVQAVSIEGSHQIVLRGIAPAEDVVVTVTAMDPDGGSAAQLINVTVIAAAPPPTPTPEPTATPEPTTPPPPTATPVPTPTPEPEEEAGFPVGLVIVLVLVLAGIAAAVFIIQRRR